MPRENRTARRKRALRVCQTLRSLYPARCALSHDNPFQLLVATILSAQCTDERVNKVTPELFSRYASPEAFAAARQESVETIIRSTGFFRSKARHILAASRALVERHGGIVPQDLKALTALDGVGRKTANVVLGTAFGIAAGVVVDTHVGRISRHLAFTRHRNPVKVEQDLMDLLPSSEWIEFSHRMIWHGRALCPARYPQCGQCPILPDCPGGKTFQRNGGSAAGRKHPGTR